MSRTEDHIPAPLNAPATSKLPNRSIVKLLCCVVLGLVSIALLQRHIDEARPPADRSAEIEELYVSADAAKRASLCFNGLVADWYWLRALQYTGRKVVEHKGDLQLNDLSVLDARLLAPLLERATTLDPQYMTAYHFGGVVLPTIDEPAAIRLLEKGIRENPQAWRLHQYLGYIHWQAGRYPQARAAYEAGAPLPDAPTWMRTMAGRMEADGASRDVAREVYRRMYAEADDEHIKQLAVNRLLLLRSQDERDQLRALLERFRTERGRCPADFREVARATTNLGFKLDATAAAPLDPSGAPYVLRATACDVDLDVRSKVPRR